MKEKFKQAGLALAVCAVLFSGAWLLFGRSAQEAGEALRNKAPAYDPAQAASAVMEKYSVGDFKGALKLLDSVIKADKKNPMNYYFKAGILYEMGQYKDAVKCFNKVLSLEPRMTDAISGKGLAYASLGKYKDAEKDMRASLEINETNPLAFYGLAYVYIMTGKPADALKYLEKFTQYGKNVFSDDYEKWMKALGKDSDAQNAAGVKIFLEENFTQIERRGAGKP
jgi:tetratricopeptide (TPR) repeat protein